VAFRPSRQFVVFLLVGGLAAASQWLSRFAFSMLAPYALAVALAYGVGLLIAFTLNRRLVFRSDQRAGGQFARFVLVNALSFAVVWGVSLGLGEVLLPRFMDARWAEALGHGIGILSPVLLSFWLHKHFTFRAKERSDP
jgi:putative flippase GtrA